MEWARRHYITLLITVSVHFAVQQHILRGGQALELNIEKHHCRDFYISNATSILLCYVTYLAKHLQAIRIEWVGSASNLIKALEY